MLQDKENRLIAYFQEKGSAAIAFSGGVDSAYLLYAAVKSGIRVRAYYVKSLFQPEFEMEDAKKLAAQFAEMQSAQSGMPAGNSMQAQADLMKIIPVDVLADEQVAKNPPNRCYYCKRQIFTTIVKEATEDGFTLLCDGTNASDDAGDRPGMVALQELHVQSPLRLLGITKKEVRELSKQAGLFTWDKPAYACLATRIPSNTCITAEMLAATESAEGYLAAIGFSDFRVRRMGDAAKLQIRAEQIPLLVEKREDILKELKQYYKDVYLDLNVRTGQD